MNMKPLNLFLNRINTLTLLTRFASSSVVATCSCESKSYMKPLCKAETSKPGLWGGRNGRKI